MNKAEQFIQMYEFAYTAHGKKKQWWNFKSKSNPTGKGYTTILWDDGTYSCNCPGWTRRVDDNKRICRHVKEVGGKPYKVS